MYGIDAKKNERWTLIFFFSLMNIEQINRAFQNGRTHETPCIYFLHHSRSNVTPEYMGDGDWAIKDSVSECWPRHGESRPFLWLPHSWTLSFGFFKQGMAWQWLWHVGLPLCVWHICDKIHLLSLEPPKCFNILSGSRSKRENSLHEKLCVFMSKLSWGLYDQQVPIGNWYLLNRQLKPKSHF